MATWRQATDARDRECPEEYFDRVRSMLEPDQQETPRLVATPEYWSDLYGRLHRSPIALMVSTDRVLLAKRGLFGIKNIQFHISDFKRYGVGPSAISGPSWELLEETIRGPMTFYFRTADSAEFVAEYINSGVAMWRTRSRGEGPGGF